MSGSLLAEVQTRELLEQITKIIVDGSAHFVFDLNKLKFINSAGLGMLLTSLAKAQKAGGEVVLASVPKQLLSLLVMTKVDNLFVIAKTVDEAMVELS